MRAPCINCPDRSATCHGSCEKYNQWKQERAEIAEAKQKSRLYYDYKVARMIKGNPRKRKMK